MSPVSVMPSRGKKATPARSRDDSSMLPVRRASRWRMRSMITGGRSGGRPSIDTVCGLKRLNVGPFRFLPATPKRSQSSSAYEAPRQCRPLASKRRKIRSTDEHR